jgi:hypothetical protein
MLQNSLFIYFTLSFKKEILDNSLPINHKYHTWYIKIQQNHQLFYIALFYLKHKISIKRYKRKLLIVFSFFYDGSDLDMKHTLQGIQYTGLLKVFI